jgi:phosphate transport system permease protein
MRRWLDRCFWGLTGLAALLACALLLGIVAFLLHRGLPALSWSFLVQDTVGAGSGGGILYQLLGTVILIATAFATAAPLAVALALAATVYARGKGTRRRFEVALYALNGLPSIVLGIVGLIVFGKLLGWGKSWLAGGLILGWMILPTVTIALLERIQAIPRRYFEAAAALGLPRGRIVRSVVLPQSLGGLISGSLLGLARAAGETAPILFTAAVFSGATLPSGIRDNPVLALPYHIFVLAQDTLDPEAGTRLWAAAFVLLALVLLLGLAALPARLAAHEEARHG